VRVFLIVFGKVYIAYGLVEMYVDFFCIFVYFLNKKMN